MYRHMFPMMPQPIGLMGSNQRANTPPPRLMAPPPMQPEQDQTMQRAMGLLAQSQKWPKQMQQPWAPMNDAAGMIRGGEYPDPLLRQSAQWQGPGILEWLRSLGSMS